MKAALCPIGAAALVCSSVLSAQAAPGHRVVSPISGTDTLLFDDTGALVHTWPSDFKVGMACYLKENGNLLRSIVTTSGPSGTGGGVQELALDGTVLWDFRYDTGGVLSHHDIEPMPGGNVLLIAWEELAPQEAIAAGRAPARISGITRPDHIVEVRPCGPGAGEIVWEWHVMDHVIQDIDPDRSDFGDVARHPERIDINFPPDRSGGELNHLNSIDYDPTHDWIVVSSSFQDEIWIIDHGTTTAEAAGSTGGRHGMGGDLLYRWGNPASYRGASSGEQVLFSPHAARFVSKGDGEPPHVLVFNNKSSPHSEVLELTLPFDGERFVRPSCAPFGPLEASWSYSAAGFDSDLMASAERLPNGNTLICSSMQIRIFEIDARGQVVWEIDDEELSSFPFHATYTARTLWVDRPSEGCATYEVRFDLMFGTRHRDEFFMLMPTPRRRPKIAWALPWEVCLSAQGFLDESGRAGITGDVPRAVHPEWIGEFVEYTARAFDLPRRGSDSTSNTIRLECIP
ncbi:MAG: arylsulfotransferase [Planctomycetes bacterium]|nr:arylsulfotransferase [Planctomycetota bacterium]